jgi:ribonuclease D
MFEKSITKDRINELPLFKYEGKVIIAATDKQIDKAIFEIEKHTIVGFDTESKPAFKKGQFNHVALIQIAVPDKVYLLRIHQVGITNVLRNFLSNPKITKIGIALDDDIIALNKRRKFQPMGFKDLNLIAPSLGIENIGARNLSALILNSRISKNQQVSNWENHVLTTPQVKYAATDAWICLEIYNKLKYWGYVEDGD